MGLLRKANTALKECKFKVVRISIWGACFNFQYLLFIKILQPMDPAKKWIKSSRKHMPAPPSLF